MTSGLAIAAKIPTIHTQFVIFSSNDIAKARTFVQLLKFAGNWLPVIAAMIAAAGVYLRLTAAGR